jgi:hypothetical protein
MKVSCISKAALLAALAGFALPAMAAPQDRPTTAMDGQWHFVIAPYFWLSGLKGDVSVRNLPDVPVEKSFSDIWSDFHVGALGHFEGSKDRWGFATDMMYIDLHAQARRPQRARTSLITASDRAVRLPSIARAAHVERPPTPPALALT